MSISKTENGKKSTMTTKKRMMTKCRLKIHQPVKRSRLVAKRISLHPLVRPSPFLSFFLLTFHFIFSTLLLCSRHLQYPLNVLPIHFHNHISLMYVIAYPVHQFGVHEKRNWLLFSTNFLLSFSSSFFSHRQQHLFLSFFSVICLQSLLLQFFVLLPFLSSIFLMFFRTRCLELGTVYRVNKTMMAFKCCR